LHIEDEFEDEMERRAIRDACQEVREEETKNLRQRVYEYCSDYYKRNGEPPDLDCVIV
jgi:nucleoid-associated protein YejK